MRNCDCSIVILGQFPRIDHFLENCGCCACVLLGILELLDSILERLELTHLLLDALLFDESFLFLELDLGLSSSSLGTDFEKVDGDTVGGYMHRKRSVTKEHWV